MGQQEPQFFSTAAKFRQWLVKHHAVATELTVGYWKVETGRPSMSWSESVDEALCFGWIDGVRKRIDEQAYQIRFTPRKSSSTWSAVNMAKYATLVAEGRMTEAGERAYARRSEKRSGIYAYEQRHEAKLSPAEERQFRGERKAWDFYAACPPSYRQVMIHWVVSAKKPETRARRLQQLIASSAEGERLRK